MNLQDLKKEIPFKWRVQSTNQYGASCVAYIDSRDAQDLLDEVCGQENWQCKYEEHKGNLFCSIGINVDGNWIWKSDCGTESNIEKQKGESSDAFKRAFVMWGGGRFLYSMPILKIKEVINENGKFHAALNGKRIWDINKHCNQIHNRTAPKTSAPKQKPAQKVNITEKQVQAYINAGVDKVKGALAYYDGKTVRNTDKGDFIYCMSDKFKTILETALKV